MADYFTLFSWQFDFGIRQNALRARQLYEHLDEEGAFADGFDLSLDDNAGGSHLWLSADHSGDTGAVIRFVQRCAQEFELTGRWGFEWANICSKLRLDGFGGGALVLDLATGGTLAWSDTHGWRTRQLVREGSLPT